VNSREKGGGALPGDLALDAGKRFVLFKADKEGGNA